MRSLYWSRRISLSRIRRRLARAGCLALGLSLAAAGSPEVAELVREESDRLHALMAGAQQLLAEAIEAGESGEPAGEVLGRLRRVREGLPDSPIAAELAARLDQLERTWEGMEAPAGTQPQDAAISMPVSGVSAEAPGDAAEAAADERSRLRAQLLREVDLAWDRPKVSARSVAEREMAAADSPLAEKLAAIHVPLVNFSGVDLRRVIHTLSAVSEEYDRTGIGPRGVNLVLLDPGQASPPVNLTLRNLPLKRILDFVTDAVGYQYEVQADAVVVRPGGETSLLDTEFFPVTRSTVVRMAGAGGAAPGRQAPEDPAGPEPGAGFGAGGEAQALRRFLQQAGVNFEGVPGSSLAYDGSAIIVTQTARNLDRIRTILNRYHSVRQVEIEAKFMEVQEGVLEELGINWTAGRFEIIDPDGTRRFKETYRSANRSLADAFAGNRARSEIVVDGVPIAALIPPSLPGGALLAPEAPPLAVISATLGDFDVNAVIRALSQQSGTDLLSAPKVTVLSGHTATITVAQELKYPQAYGNIESRVSPGSSGFGGGGGGISITTGTPRDFATRNIGVELTVTPTVEDDDYSISLDLNPRVTEFEGFVEYGGPSIALEGGRSVTVPSGFFQPIFSVREVDTRVTLWDGATLIMGGLTREEVKSVADRVPVLGSIPVLGRLFRSKGQTSQKRNLLIFVTANLVSPGGSPKKQALEEVEPNTLFQSPAWVTPAGVSAR